MSSKNEDMNADGGWAASARAYIALIDRGDPNRELLLDPVMLGLCGEVSGLTVLDLGCGEGRFCRMLAEREASTIGIDPTSELVREARRRGDERAGWVMGTGEKLPFREEAFDLVVSYVTLVDIVDYVGAIQESARVLKHRGSLVVANLGFVTASSGWLRDEQGNRLYHRVDRYAEEWAQVYEWAGMKIVNWHRPLSAYMSAYLSSGLILQEFLEPVPEDESLRHHPDFEDWFRVPLFNVMKWRKSC